MYFFQYTAFRVSKKGCNFFQYTGVSVGEVKVDFDTVFGVRMKDVIFFQYTGVSVGKENAVPAAAVGFPVLQWEGLPAPHPLLHLSVLRRGLRVVRVISKFITSGRGHLQTHQAAPV